MKEIVGHSIRLITLGCLCLGLAESCAATASRGGAESPAVVANDEIWSQFRVRLAQSKRAVPSGERLVRNTGIAAGLILGSALLDRPADRFMKTHRDSRLVQHWGSFGEKMPFALAGAGAFALAFGDSRSSNVGLISVQAVAGSIAISGAGKWLFARARPHEELGSFARVGPHGSRADASFPSGHSAVAFAAVTPFAKEYDAPWLYGLAALSAAGRVASRDHWVSDTVGGGLIGYAVGSWLWEAQRNQPGFRWSIVPGPGQVSVAWGGTY